MSPRKRSDLTWPYVPKRFRRGYEAMVERIAADDGVVVRYPRHADPQGFWPEDILERWCRRRLRTLELRMMRGSDSPTPAAGSRPQPTTEGSA